MAKRKRSPISPTAAKTIVVIVLALTMGIFVCKQFYNCFTRSGYFSVKAVVIDPSLSFINRRELSNLNGKNIFKLDLKEIERHLTYEYPQVSDLRVVRHFPNQIHILAKPRNPVAQIEASKKILTLDENGIVLSSSTSKNEKLPLINVKGNSYSRYLLGEPLKGSDHKVALDIVKYFGINRALSSYQIEAIAIENLSKVDVYLSNKLHIIFDSSKVDQKVKVLSLILAQGKVDPKEVKYIDLRFKEPIVGKK